MTGQEYINNIEERYSNYKSRPISQWTTFEKGCFATKEVYRVARPIWLEELRGHQKGGKR